MDKKKNKKIPLESITYDEDGITITETVLYDRRVELLEKINNKLEHIFGFAVGLIITFIIMLIISIISII